MKFLAGYKPRKPPLCCWCASPVRRSRVFVWGNGTEDFEFCQTCVDELLKLRERVMK